MSVFEGFQAIEPSRLQRLAHVLRSSADDLQATHRAVAAILHSVGEPDTTASLHATARWADEQAGELMIRVRAIHEGGDANPLLALLYGIPPTPHDFLAGQGGELGDRMDTLLDGFDPSKGIDDPSYGADEVREIAAALEEHAGDETYMAAFCNQVGPEGFAKLNELLHYASIYGDPHVDWPQDVLRPLDEALAAASHSPDLAFTGKDLFEKTGTGVTAFVRWGSFEGEFLKDALRPLLLQSRMVVPLDLYPIVGSDRDDPYPRETLLGAWEALRRHQQAGAELLAEPGVIDAMLQRDARTPEGLASLDALLQQVTVEEARTDPALASRVASQLFQGVANEGLQDELVPGLAQISGFYIDDLAHVANGETAGLDVSRDDLVVALTAIAKQRDALADLSLYAGAYTNLVVGPGIERLLAHPGRFPFEDDGHRLGALYGLVGDGIDQAKIDAQEQRAFWFTVAGSASSLVTLPITLGGPPGFVLKTAISKGMAKGLDTLHDHMDAQDMGEEVSSVLFEQELRNSTVRLALAHLHHIELPEQFQDAAGGFAPPAATDAEGQAALNAWIQQQHRLDGLVSAVTDPVMHSVNDAVVRDEWDDWVAAN